MKRRTFLRSAIAAAAASIPGKPLWAAGYRLVQQTPPDVDGITLDGDEITLRGRAVAELRNRMGGRLLLANQDGYDQARRVLNPSFDKHPALIAQVTGTERETPMTKAMKRMKAMRSNEVNAKLRPLSKSGWGGGRAATPHRISSCTSTSSAARRRTIWSSVLP